MSRKTTDNILAGKRILVTRPRHQAESFINLLLQEGAEPIALPTIEIIPPDTWEPVDRAIAALDQYGWIIFSSVNGVRYFCRHLRKVGHAISELEQHLIISVGPKTAGALAEEGLTSTMLPEEYQGEGILKILEKTAVAGCRFLLPRAKVAREILPETLRSRGAIVDVVPVYQSIFPQSSADRLDRLFADREAIDMVTFTSSSTVTNLVSHCRQLPAFATIRQLPVACIGPITADTAREAGLNVQVVAADYTVEGLIDAMKTWLNQSGTLLNC
ncbi:MAG: uroporphyrinogen-III synthase [Deltaproteobacteria bacterium]|nr:uroporphyrinogen-III synthase [Candidatus Anaeroferrophillus wilburensis]MBN2888027.1 uroporphyrinogen-III synthase [Deltaproteobacteria bacterium]